MAEEKPEQAAEKRPRGKKINKMTLPELEKKLEEIKTAQGGLASRYARELTRRAGILKAANKL